MWKFYVIVIGGGGGRLREQEVILKADWGGDHLHYSQLYSKIKLKSDLYYCFHHVVPGHPFAETKIYCSVSQ